MASSKHPLNRGYRIIASAAQSGVKSYVMINGRFNSRNNSGEYSMSAFKCKIENHSTHDLIIKIAGANAQYNLHLNAGESLITPPGQYLNEGERLVIGWDDFDEKIVCFGVVTIDKQKRIKLYDSGVAFAAPAGTAASVQEEDAPGI